MSAARPLTADIDASIARGEWWLRLFGELSDLALQRSHDLPDLGAAPSRGIVQALDRALRAVRLAIVATLGLGRILSGLADLRKRCADDIAAARVSARAKAEEAAAARERCAQRANARRKALEVEIPPAETDGPEGDKPESDAPEPGLKPEPRDRDPLVESLEKRLAAVDPAIVDFEDLQLRETVLRICADLGVAPDWGRWEAGDWATPDTPKTAPAPVPAPPRGPLRLSRRVRSPPILPDIPEFAARPTDTALARVVLAELDASRWRPNLE